MKRVAILISGAGSNMVALADSMTGGHPGRPVLVLSNSPDAGGLAKAAARGIATAVVDHRTFGCDRAAFEAHMQTAHFAKMDAESADMVARKLVHTGQVI